jgi:hypothetical protein
MASLADLQTLLNDPMLRNKIRSAVVITAKNVYYEAPETPSHAARLAWAKSVFANPDAAAEQVVRFVVASNATASVEAILTAGDSTIQSAVGGAVNLFI